MMQSFIAKLFNLDKISWIVRIVALILLVLMFQALLVLPLLKQTPHLQTTIDKSLCVDMGRRTRMLHEFHFLQPSFDPTRASTVIQKLRQLQPQILIKDDRETQFRLLASLDGTDCSLIEQLWSVHSRQGHSLRIKSRGDFYALFLKATTKTLDPFSDFNHFSKLEQMQVPNQNAHQKLGLIVLNRQDYLLVSQILPFTASEKEGSLQAGDKIVAIQDNAGKIINFSDSSLKVFKQYLRANKQVSLVVKRQEETIGNRTFTVTIRKDKIPTHRAFFYITSVEGRKIGVINLPLFYVNSFQMAAGGDYEGAAPDVLKALKALQKENVAAVLLDLRGNLGGDKDEASRILGYFLGRTVALKIRYADSKPKIYPTLADKVYDGPVGVLINRLSASASELVAGAIQDNKRGLILGENSYGKWTVQNVFLFPGLGMEEFSGQLRVTVGETMTPLEHRYPSVGLKPDILIPSSTSGPEGDQQLRQALQMFNKQLDVKLSLN